jgi:cell wall-associated NlpC family hydrolase
MCITMLTNFARAQLGCPYIFGAAGQTCTPKYRESVIASKPTYADVIRRNCPVLSGKQVACQGCKYNGKPSYDCRGLTRLAVKAATGRAIQGAGATSQWNDASNWDIKGAIAAMPDRPCIVFVAKGSTMSHTGVYIGSGQVIHASGHNSGVIMSPMPRSWTHYGIPIG